MAHGRNLPTPDEIWQHAKNDSFSVSFFLVSCIPQYPNQPVEERPGYQDDPDVEPEAKEYDIEDYIMYRNYLNIEVPNIRKEFCRKTVFAQQSAAEQQREKERKKFERSKSKDLSRDLSLINKDLNRTPSKNTDIKNRGSPISETDLTKDYWLSFEFLIIIKLQNCTVERTQQCVFIPTLKYSFTFIFDTLFFCSVLFARFCILLVYNLNKF